MQFQLFLTSRCYGLTAPKSAFSSSFCGYKIKVLKFWQCIAFTNCYWLSSYHGAGSLLGTQNSSVNRKTECLPSVGLQSGIAGEVQVKNGQHSFALWDQCSHPFLSGVSSVFIPHAPNILSVVSKDSFYTTGYRWMMAFQLSTHGIKMLTDLCLCHKSHQSVYVYPKSLLNANKQVQQKHKHYLVDR